MVECHSCGESYSQLSQHWRQSSCDRPNITEKQWQILKGLMFGDGRLVSKDERNPYISLSNTKEEFVQWFDRQMGTLTTGVTEKTTEDKKNWSTVYVCSTRTHPEFRLFDSWYDSGSVQPPKVDYTPLLVKCWYVSDGTVSTSSDSRPIVRFCSRKAEGVKQKMRDGFLEHGFNPTWSSTQLVFNADESRRLLTWMEDPLPGFDYKWPDDPELKNTYSMPEERPWQDVERFQHLRYEKGLSYSEMADEWDCSTSTVHKWDERHDFN